MSDLLKSNTNVRELAEFRYIIFLIQQFEMCLNK